MAISSAYQLGLGMYGLDGDTSAARGEVWRLLEPHLDALIDRYLDNVLAFTPEYHDTIQAHGTEFRAVIRKYTERLFVRPFDEAWINDVKTRVEEEVALGLDMRTRGVISKYLLTGLQQLVVGRPTLNKRRAMRIVDMGTRVLLLDEANAVALHYNAQAKAAKLRDSRLGSAIEAFGQAIGSIRSSMTEAAASLKDTSNDLTGAAGQALDQVQTASRAAVDSAGNVNIMAAATEELTSSIAEIGEQAEGSAGMVQEAVVHVDRSQGTARLLSEAVEKIGSVAGFISQVASHTNLLALNATIEAARAGEAGRGFAVVAAEVKTLAAQISKATQDIAKQIDVIQQATRQSVHDIEGTRQIIAALAGRAAAVAASVSEQTSATSSIAEGASNAALNAATVSEALKAVDATVARTRVAAEAALNFWRDLSERTAEIGGAVDRLFEAAAEDKISKLSALASRGFTAPATKAVVSGT
jgi:methyl-accepting chemotaxis protein